MPSLHDYTIEKVARLVDPRSLQLILMPTEKCNFRCTYCYEDFVLGRMSASVIAGIKALMNERARDLTHLYLGWFGGEPLLAADIISEISIHAQHLADHNAGLEYRGGITTNAYLLSPNMLTKLTRVGILDYQITLDGPRSIHNRTRLRADGRGTFDEIWANLLACRDSSSPIAVTLRVHFDAESAPFTGELLHQIKRELLIDPRFSVFIKPLEQLSPVRGRINKLSPHEEARVLASLNAMVSEHAAVGDDVCYASRPNSIVIRSDGRIGKCTVALDDARNTIGRLNVDGSLTIHSKRLAVWLRGLSTLDTHDLACPLYQMDDTGATEHVIPVTAISRHQERLGGATFSNTE